MTEEKKQAVAADVLFQYSKFAMACMGMGNQVRPCDMRLLLMKIGQPTSLKRVSSQAATSPDSVGESSSSDTARRDKEADTADK
ncbi:hypothetical protein E1A91_D11G328800v1 [Gossypium mustelinum]|uniref:Uncharacterized protein n=1 Tax=Gossypium mustelinum TaxID=34275 RepID=A0A5D2T0A1_GOSMU|nr:hypothetical protein E1A91_D11G328800v1 [Gossypium mustelinum]